MIDNQIYMIKDKSSVINCWDTNQKFLSSKSHQKFFPFYCRRMFSSPFDCFCIWRDWYRIEFTEYLTIVSSNRAQMNVNRCFVCHRCLAFQFMIMMFILFIFSWRITFWTSLLYVCRFFFSWKHVFTRSVIHNQLTNLKLY